jgi:hypothetical protein
MVSAPTDRYSADDWWRVREGIQSYANEYAKLAAYWIFYGSGLVWLCLFAAIFIALLYTRHRHAKRLPNLSSPIT